MSGDSTCLVPDSININKFATNAHKNILLIGLYWRSFVLPKSTKASANKANIAANINIVPASLLGMDLKIA